MRHIAKSQEPPQLKEFKRTNPKKWDEIHQTANKVVYEACLLQCMLDQDELCGYTEMRLDGAVHTHIDHYIKRDLAPQLTFEWGNMVAAVKDSRFGADYKDNHIGIAVYDSINNTYQNVYNPITDNLVGVFAFSTDGGIEPADPADVKAIGTIILFNLDDGELRARRKECMAAVRSMRQGGLSDVEILDILSPGGFVSALAYEIGHS